MSKTWAEGIGNIVSGLANFFGLGDEVDKMFASWANYNPATEAEAIRKLENVANKLSSKYNIDLQDIIEKTAALSGIPISRFSLKAIQQEKRKLDNKRKKIEDDYASKAADLTKARELQNQYSLQTKLSKTQDKTLLDSANDIIKSVEGGL